MIVYGCNLINGNISTMMFGGMVYESLDTLRKKIKNYKDSDFYEDYSYEDFEYPLYFKIIYGDINCNILNELLKNEDYSAINDKLLNEVIVYKPIEPKFPYGDWEWKGCS